jgi:hypothetical protein
VIVLAIAKELVLLAFRRVLLARGGLFERQTNAKGGVSVVPARARQPEIAEKELYYWLVPGYGILIHAT